MPRNDTRLPEGETTPMANRAGLVLAGPIGAFIGGLLLFALFVFGASHNETAQQQTAQPQSPQTQPAETTGQAPAR